MMNPNDVLSNQAYLLNENMLDKLSALLETYQRNKDSAFPVEEVSILIREAGQLFQAPDSFQLSGDLKWSDVLELGRPADWNQEQRGEWTQAASAEFFAALAGQSDTFALRCASWNGPAFSIGFSNENGDMAEALLRACCKHIRICPAVAPRPALGRVQSWAECRMIFMDNGSSEQKLFRDKASNWMDSIAAALPGKKYSIEIRFDRTDEAYLRKQLRTVQNLEDWLEAYKELSWQVSGNVGTGINETGSILRETERTLSGSVRDTPNYGMSVSMSRTLHRSDAEQCAEWLRYHSTRLAQALRGGAHFVTITASAESSSVLAALQAVFNGALSGNGLRLHWHSGNFLPERMEIQAEGVEITVK